LSKDENIHEFVSFDYIYKLKVFAKIFNQKFSLLIYGIIMLLYSYEFNNKSVYLYTC
jgi:hypothetical protein